MPLAVGLAGAGPWATTVHAPTLAAGPETRLAGIWSRTTARAERLARSHGVPACASFEALLECCDAVAFAVPPDVQADLAWRAARAGKAVLLEKPVAPDFDGARRLADVVEELAVGSIVVLTYRFIPDVRAFLDTAAGFAPSGARACFLSGAFLGGVFAGGWRAQQGALVDVGPHLLDLVEAAMGRIVSISAATSADDWTAATTIHASGAITELSISCSVPITPSRTELELLGANGAMALDARQGREQAFALLRAEFARAARDGGGHRLDARHGARVQQLVDATRRAASTGTRQRV